VEDDLVEAGIRAAGEEAVELHKELDVDIIGLGLTASGLFVLVVTVDKIDSPVY
jgi:hypothetical protein